MHPESSRTNRRRRVACLVTVATAFGLFAAGCGGAAATTTSSTPLDARQTVAHLKAQGLPISSVQTYTAASDPNSLLGRPGQYTSKANFRDRRVKPSGFGGVQDGGSVEVFANNTNAQARYKYVRAITQATSIFAEYDYRDGRTLLRLSHQLTPAQAGQYAAALKRV